jgi:Photosynthetic reaction centre cytochrome C subunit
MLKRALALTVVALAFAACAAMQQQKSQIRADEGVFKNLQVFPQNITHDELISAMRGFTRGLGTRCDHCHVANPAGSAEQFNFASDAKPEKNVGRTMLRMTRAINADYLAKVNEHGTQVTCWTCHQGNTVPVAAPAAPPAPPAPAPRP